MYHMWMNLSGEKIELIMNLIHPPWINFCVIVKDF